MDKLEFALWPIPPFGGDNRTEVNNDDSSSDAGNDGDKDNDSNSSKGASKDNGSSDESDSDSDEDDDEDEDDEYEGLSAKDLKKRLREANKAGKSTAAELKTLQDAQEKAARKERTELENANKDRDKYKGESEAKDKIIEKQAILQGIITYQDITFHDPKDVIAFINKSDITINDEGEAEGLVKQLKDLAKEKPYLVKSKKGSNNNDDSNNGRNGSTGTQPGQGAKGKTDANAKQKQELISTYPALIGR